MEARLYSTGINEVLEKITQEKANMLYSTENIFKNSRYLYSTTDYDGDPNIYRWNYFYTPVQIGENIVGVRIAVRDIATPQGSQIYNWNIKRDASLDSEGRGTNDRISHGVSSNASNYNISKRQENVNSIQKEAILQGGVASFVDENGYKNFGNTIQNLNPNEVISGMWEDSPNALKDNVEKSRLESVENVGENDIIDYNKQAYKNSNISLLPKQMHHFATNKNSKYTPEFKKIVSKYGLDLDGRWNKEKMNHLGRHPNEYHKFILYHINRIDKLAKGDTNIFLSEFDSIKKEILNKPNMLRKAYWKGEYNEVLQYDLRWE